MNVRSLSLATMVAIAVSAEAGDITEKQAREIASRFLSSSQVTTTRAIGETTLNLAQKSSGYYAFNRANGAGFVVVASSDNAAAQVLGYADKGSISPGDMPANLKAWLEEYDRQMAFAEAHPQLSSATTAYESKKTIAPLLATLWDQESPYNDMCPQFDEKTCPTGCVATAAAQVMYYHKWPKQGQGSTSYTSSYNGYKTDVAVDFSQSTYDWDAMEKSYNSESSQAANEAVALLMRDVGAATHMKYTVDGSDAEYYDLGYGLIKYMDYDNGLTRELREYYTHDEWDNMVYSELANSRPLLYAGYNAANSKMGHAFVLDGYEDGYYHINWGWGGLSNGYFMLSALAPKAQGVGGVGYNYNYKQEVLVGVQPNTHSSSVVAPNVVCGPMSVSYPSASDVTIGINVKYLGFEDVELQCGVKVKSANGDSTYILSQPQTVVLNGDVTSITMPLSSFALEDGTYTLSAIVYDPATKAYYEPRTRKTGLDGGSCYLTAVVSDGNVTFSSPATPQQSKLSSTFDLPSTIYAGSSFIGNVSVTAVDGDFYGDVRLRFDNGESHVESSNLLVDLAKGESYDTKMILIAPPVAGQYNAYIVDTLGNALSDTLVVAVADAITSTLGFEVTAMRMDNTTNVDPSNINVEMDVKCTGGTYCNNFYLVFEMDGKLQNSYLVSNLIYMKEGDEKTIMFSGALPELEPATTYACLPRYCSMIADMTYLFQIPTDGITFTTAGTTAISSVAANGDPSEIKIYSLDGTLVDSQYGVTPSLDAMPKGLYIIKQGGKTTKVVR